MLTYKEDEAKDKLLPFPNSGPSRSHCCSWWPPHFHLSGPLPPAQERTLYYSPATFWETRMWKSPEAQAALIHFPQANAVEDPNYQVLPTFFWVEAFSGSTHSIPMKTGSCSAGKDQVCDRRKNALELRDGSGCYFINTAPQKKALISIIIPLKESQKMPLLGLDLSLQTQKTRIS